MPMSRCSASRRPATASTTDKHAASLAGGEPGVLHGNRTFLLQDEDGQITEAHSISAGLDYPGIGPEHSWLHDIGRVKYESATDREALDAFQLLCRTEGIIPALEPSHALAAVARKAREMKRRPDHRRQSVRPRRQGHLHRRRCARGGDMTKHELDEVLDRHTVRLSLLIGSLLALAGSAVFLGVMLAR